MINLFGEKEMKPVLVQNIEIWPRLLDNGMIVVSVSDLADAWGISRAGVRQKVKKDKTFNSCVRKVISRSDGKTYNTLLLDLNDVPFLAATYSPGSIGKNIECSERQERLRNSWLEYRIEIKYAVRDYLRFKTKNPLEKVLSSGTFLVEQIKNLLEHITQSEEIENLPKEEIKRLCEYLKEKFKFNQDIQKSLDQILNYLEIRISFLLLPGSYEIEERKIDKWDFLHPDELSFYYNLEEAKDSIDKLLIYLIQNNHVTSLDHPKIQKIINVKSESFENKDRSLVLKEAYRDLYETYIEEDPQDEKKD